MSSTSPQWPKECPLTSTTWKKEPRKTSSSSGSPRLQTCPILLTCSALVMVDTEALKLGVAGVSIINSSGDDGAPGTDAKDDACACAYTPAFSSASPYVTSVGATQVRYFWFLFFQSIINRFS